jgi:hypothetical protein
MPAIGARTVVTEIELLRRLGFERGDLRVVFAEDAQAATHRVKGYLVGADGILRGYEIGLRMLPIF